jgi:phosphatidylglycerophosphate synthase
MRVVPGDTGVPEAGALRGSALASILPALALGGFAAVAFGEAAGLGTGYALRAALLLLGGGALLLAGLPAHAPHTRFGSANRVTLVRAVLVVLLLALVGEAPLQQPATFLLAATAASLDALDGYVARRAGLTSRYGARFDMETDALLILALSLLLWWSGRVPAWILAAGALRYAFLAATLVLSRLGGELAPSRRRQVVAVVQGVTLLLALAPFVPRAAGIAAAAAGLAALLYSFGVDTYALWRGGAVTR